VLPSLLLLKVLFPFETAGRKKPASFPLLHSDVFFNKFRHLLSFFMRCGSDSEKAENPSFPLQADDEREGTSTYLLKGEIWNNGNLFFFLPPPRFQLQGHRSPTDLYFRRSGHKSTPLFLPPFRLPTSAQARRIFPYFRPAATHTLLRAIFLSFSPSGSADPFFPPFFAAQRKTSEAALFPSFPT